MSRTSEEMLTEFKKRRDTGEFSGPYWKSKEQKQAWYDAWRKNYNSVQGMIYRASQPAETIEKPLF